MDLSDHNVQQSAAVAKGVTSSKDHTSEALLGATSLLLSLIISTCPHGAAAAHKVGLPILDESKNFSDEQSRRKKSFSIFSLVDCR
jgi:hypothetical protein